MQELAKELERDQTRTSMPADSSQMGGEGKARHETTSQKKRRGESTKKMVLARQAIHG